MNLDIRLSLKCSAASSQSILVLAYGGNKYLGITLFVCLVESWGLIKNGASCSKGYQCSEHKYISDVKGDH
jgi:hypothetical protein